MASEDEIDPINLIVFQQIKDSLGGALFAGLEEEVAMDEFDSSPEGDLWDLPTVDSKTVIKLSPIVEKATGRKVKVEWIKQGGYDSVEEAVNDLMAHIEKACSEEE